MCVRCGTVRRNATRKMDDEIRKWIPGGNAPPRARAVTDWWLEWAECRQAQGSLTRSIFVVTFVWRCIIQTLSRNRLGEFSKMELPPTGSAQVNQSTHRPAFKKKERFFFCFAHPRKNHRSILLAARSNHHQSPPSLTPFKFYFSVKHCGATKQAHTHTHTHSVNLRQNDKQFVVAFHHQLESSQTPSRLPTIY